MGLSVIPDSGRPGYGISNDVGLKQMRAYLRGYFGGGVELADVLTELQSRYRPPIIISQDRLHRAPPESRVAEIQSECAADQLRCKRQISDGVEKAIRCSAMVASLFAAMLFLLEITHLVRLLHEW